MNFYFKNLLPTFFIYPHLMAFTYTSWYQFPPTGIVPKTSSFPRISLNSHLRASPVSHWKWHGKEGFRGPHSEFHSSQGSVIFIVPHRYSNFVPRNLDPTTVLSPLVRTFRCQQQLILVCLRQCTGSRVKGSEAARRFLSACRLWAKGFKLCY
jgi:hypothetical protein